MGMRMLPFFKSKKGWQFAGGGNIDEYGDLPIATENSPGCVKPDGTTTTVSSAGALSANTATGSAAGIVKPDGSTITIEDGVISAATATGSAAGIVKPDGETIEINDGEISTTALLQKEELPTASEDELGKRYLYTGATGSGLVNGYVYKCVSDGGNPATYSWVEVDVQGQGVIETSVTSDGVKTYNQLLVDLLGLISIDFNKINKLQIIGTSGSVQDLSFVAGSSSNIVFTNVRTTDTTEMIRTIRIHSTDGYYIGADTNISTGVISTTNYTSQVPDSGIVIKYISR